MFCGQLRIDGTLQAPLCHKRCATMHVPEIMARQLSNQSISQWQFISRRCFELFDGTRTPWEVPSELRRNLIVELWPTRDEELNKCIEDMDAFCSAASSLSDSLKRYRDCR